MVALRARVAELEAALRLKDEHGDCLCEECDAARAALEKTDED